MSSRPSAQEVVAALASRVEAYVKKKLVALGGIIIRSQLPQGWTFKIDQEEFSFEMDRQGNVKLISGALPHPDVRIVTSYDRLMANLNSATRGETPPAPLGVSFGSNRGRRAYYYVRRNIGI